MEEIIKSIIIKTDKNNKFIDQNNNEVKKYDPSLNLSFKCIIDEKEYIINNDKISYNYGESMSFIVNNNRYIIDDGYRNILVKCGYLVLNNYDHIPYSSSNGPLLREQLMNKIAESVDKIKSDKYTVDHGSLSSTVIFKENGYIFTIKFVTINAIVTKNQKRTENNISIYPFDKSMDKFGTCYVAIFAEKQEELADLSGSEKIISANKFIDYIINDLCINNDNLYKFVPLNINNKLIFNWENI